MKRTVTILLVTLALVAAAVVTGWLYFRANPAAWDEFTAEMQGETTVSSAPRPSERPVPKGGELLASGSIEVETITIASEWGGRVVQVATAEGEQASAGDMLLQLDQSLLLAQRAGAEAAVAQAQAAVDAAQAQLAQAQAGAREEDIATAEGAVQAARGSLAAAEAAVNQAEINAEIARSNLQAESAVGIAEAGVSQAQGALSAARADLTRAQAELTRLLAGARPEEIALYQAYVAQAEALLQFPKQVHETLLHNQIYGTQEEQARLEVQAAQSALDAAQAQLDLVLAGVSGPEIAAMRAVVMAAEAQVDIAEAGVDAAEEGVTQAENTQSTNQSQIALAEAGTATAQAQVAVAQGLLDQAEAQQNKLEAGATTEEIAMLQAQVDQAQAALATAEAAVTALDIQLAQMTISAPVGGIVLEQLVHVGELAAPGAPVFTLADLDEVTLTVYVPEAELDRVSLGQEVEVTVDAYSRAFDGQVVHIASEAEFTPKNVQTQEERVHMVFAVKVLLANPEHELKPGMPADAIFQR